MGSADYFIDMLNKIPILLAISLGLVLFVAKIRFIFKVGRAKTDFNVFNYSLAIRLIASGMVKGPEMNIPKAYISTIVCRLFLREKNQFAQIEELGVQLHTNYCQVLD